MPVSVRSGFVTTMLMLAIALGGAALWAAAAIGVAQYTEDLRFDDLDVRAGYGAYRTEWTLWPPSFDCELRGNEVDPIVVQHRGVATVALTTVAAMTIVYAAAATAGVIVWRRRRRVGRR